CGVGMLVLDVATPLYGLLRGLLGDTFAGSTVAEVVVAAAVFGPPAAWMGIVFSALAQHGGDKPSGVGYVLGWNTLGGAMAPLFFGVVLLPVAGVKWSLAVIIAGYWLLAFWILSIRHWAGADPGHAAPGLGIAQRAFAGTC